MLKLRRVNACVFQLKERISCMERGSPFHSEKFYNEHNSPPYSNENFSGDMTQDSGPSEEDNKERIQLIGLDCENTGGCSLELNSFVGDRDVNKNEKEPNNFGQEEKESENKSDVPVKNSCGDPEKAESVRCNNSDFTISSSVNSMKSIRMNIRRKRFCSNSSAVSNNDSVSEEKRPCRRVKKRRKRNFFQDLFLSESQCCCFRLC